MKEIFQNFKMETTMDIEYDKLRSALRYWLYGNQYYISVKAMEFAAKYHNGMRKDGITPEFYHQLSIAGYIRTLGLLHPEETMAVAFLHDIVEDYNVSISELERRFGKQVSFAVSLLSKKKDGYTIENAPYYLNICNNPIASIVKGADRIHNFQTMIDVFDIPKQQKYIEDCKEGILPMLKKARRKYPEQEPAYENIKHALLSQIDLIECIHKYKKDNE